MKKKRITIYDIIFFICLAGAFISFIFLIKTIIGSKNAQQTPRNILIDNFSTKSLPSEEEAKAKINQIKVSKNLDDSRATFEFLASYVPHINWWEINSLAELDAKIKLVNDSTGFSPFKEIPIVEKFNKEAESNIQHKSLLFLVTVMPRNSDNSIDWKGYNNAQEYFDNCLKPLLENRKFKPSFATIENLQELDKRLATSVNSQLVSICSGFADLDNVNGLNSLVNEYLGKIFQGLVYNWFVERLAEELGSMGVNKYELEESGNYSEKIDWGIHLKELKFKSRKRN